MPDMSGVVTGGIRWVPRWLAVGDGRWRLPSLVRAPVLHRTGLVHWNCLHAVLQPSLVECFGKHSGAVTGHVRWVIQHTFSFSCAHLVLRCSSTPNTGQLWCPYCSSPWDNAHVRSGASSLLIPDRSGAHKKRAMDFVSSCVFIRASFNLCLKLSTCPLMSRLRCCLIIRITTLAKSKSTLDPFRLYLIY